MKKIALDFKKMYSVRISTQDQRQVIGGGKKASDRNSGGCRYSRRNPDTTTCVDAEGNEYTCTTGCV